MTARRARWSLLALLVCAVAASVVVVAARSWLGPWLVVNEPLTRSDAIFVMDGQTPQRELEGAALFLDGWAPRVALTRPRDTLSPEVRRLTGEAVPQERAVRVLLRRGVPEAAIVKLEPIVENTLQELTADFEHARAQGWRRVILVSSPYHTRRIRVIWTARFEREIPAIVRASRYEPVDSSRWWRSRRPLEDVVHEVFGITNFFLGSPVPTFDRGR
jgi:uncharacterized SAM-binding protein YcdF (DUF218 family)